MHAFPEISKVITSEVDGVMDIEFGIGLSNLLYMTDSVSDMKYSEYVIAIDNHIPALSRLGNAFAFCQNMR
jgi:hypothetical protein